MRIAILFGGKSGEHEVSCISAASILKAIDRQLHEPVLIGIDHSGIWHLQDTPGQKAVLQRDFSLKVEKQESFRQIQFQPGPGLISENRSLEIDMCFPVLHGTFGEDGTVQGLLELLDIPYVGSGVPGSSISMDKELSKLLWQEKGLPVVPWLTLHKHTYINNPDEVMDEIVETIGLPAFIKPARGGSSVGVYKAHNREELASCILEAFSYDIKLLAEMHIDAIEIECSVLGNSRVETFPPASIQPTHEYYDYEAKYQDPDGARFTIPANVPESVCNRIRDYAATAFKAVEARGLARVDFFYHQADNKFYINEINTMPGFTEISLFPRMCAHGGLSYGELIQKLLVLAEEEHNIRSGLRYDR
ncbi:D-alanine--D-alanine ligase family protein [Spirochaeta dissipatitropha]